jgi:RNA polymerase sigma-70 factor, ECF subfamily
MRGNGKPGEVRVRPRRGEEQRALDDATDRALMARHVEGDPDAFSELFNRHRDRLWAVALRTIGDPEEAADALQDAAVSAFRAAAKFRAESAVGTWLYRIVVNACLDRARKRAARPTVSYPDEQSPAWQRAVRDPSDMAESRDLRIVLESALATLPLDQRAAVVAVDVEGLSVEEAAHALGVPVGTIKSRCARGRGKLAVLLADLRNHPAAAPVQSQTPRRAHTDQGSADQDSARQDSADQSSGGKGVGENPESMERGVR